MPKYKNVSGTRKTVAGQMVEPNGLVETTVWVKNIGLLMVDEQPMFNPTIISRQFSRSEVVQIPEGETKFCIHFHAERGYPTVHYSSMKNNPPLLLYPGAKWNIRVYERTIDKLILTLMDGDILWLQIERI